MIQSLLQPQVWGCLLIVLVGLIYYRRPRSSLPDLPCLNKREGEWFSTIRARFRSTFNYQETISQAYHEVYSTWCELQYFCLIAE
jgi:hypothetical protein